MSLEDKIKALQERASLLEAAKKDSEDAEDNIDDNGEDESIEGEDESQPEKKEKAVKESTDKIDLGALFDGTELSEEFKQKAQTVFESAVAARVAQEREALEEELAQRAINESEELKEGLVDKVDGYLDFMVEQWIKNNNVALERGIKAEIFESFVTKMAEVFNEHNINLPDEEFDILESSITKAEELEAALNEQVAQNIELNKTIKQYAKDALIKEHSEGMTDIDAEKFALLAEEIQFDDAESFASKLNVIRENYVSKSSSAKETKQLTEDVTKNSDAPVEEINEEVKKVKDLKDDDFTEFVFDGHDIIDTFLKSANRIKYFPHAAYIVTGKQIGRAHV